LPLILAGLEGHFQTPHTNCMAMANFDAHF